MNKQTSGAWLLALAFVSGAHADGTLFRWSFAPEVSGGPDLSEPIVTDRPDFTEASSTVGKGVLQLESGYTVVYDQSAGETETVHSWGEPLFRLGVWEDWFELRLGVFPLTERTDDNTTSGVDDSYLGAKFMLTPQAGLAPEMSLVPQMRVPTGSSAFTADEVLPGLNWLYGWDIDDIFSTGGSTQFNRRVDDVGESYTEWAQSWTVNAALADNIGSYLEYFVIAPHSAVAAETEHYVDGGFTYRPVNDVQFDIRAGVGLNEAAADMFAGIGLSLRYW